MKFALLLSLTVLGGCAKCEFREGDIVQFKLSGSKAQVIYVDREQLQVCQYTVRVNANQDHTNTRIFSADDPMQKTPVAVVRYVREYELERPRITP